MGFRGYIPWALVWRWAVRQIKACNSVDRFSDLAGNYYLGVKVEDGLWLVKRDTL